MYKILAIPQATFELPIQYLIDLYGGDGKVSNSSWFDDAWIPVAYGIILPDGYTAQQESDVSAIIAGWDTLTLTYDNPTDSVLLTQAVTAACYLYLDTTGNGYELQPAQDDFTPIDLILGGLTVPGSYLVFAINESTFESGYIEFEVT
jgi:hypothetical protein